MDRHPRPAAGAAALVGATGLAAVPLVATGLDGARAPPMTQGACRFVLGFATVRAQLPAQVGRCLEDQQTNAQNGDASQRVTGGLLVWRKADTWMAFTDGFRTWVNGPRGLQQRLNTQRYRWEGDVGAPGTTLITDAPPGTQPAPPPGAGFDPRRFIEQGNAYTSGDLRSQADAQAVLRAAPSAPNGLDAADDGIACENNRASFDDAPVRRPPGAAFRAERRMGPG